MGAELLFRNLWKTSKEIIASEPDRNVIGILSFEVASLMSKLVSLWQSLEDREFLRLREEIVSSLGIKTFISEDDDYLTDLAVLEIMENAGCVARAVVSLGKKCVDPTYRHLEQVFDNPVEINLDWCGCEYRLKQMGRKVKKMEKFVAATLQLYQELEVLAELEQTWRRMQGNPDTSQVKLLEFEQKVMWQRQEVKNLKEMSPWVRTYGYSVRLLLRSIFTILARVKLVCGMNKIGGGVNEVTDPFGVNKSCLVRNNSISALMQSSVHQAKNNRSVFHSDYLVRSFSNLGIAIQKNRPNCRKLHPRHHSFIFGGKQQQIKTILFAGIGPFKGCMSGSDTPVVQSLMPSSSDILRLNSLPAKDFSRMMMSASSNSQPVTCGGLITPKVFLLNVKHKLLNPPSSTLGHAALAFHYANIIVLIERLVSSPHSISLDARDDLYNMLTTSIKSSLRARLKGFTKSFASSVHDASLAAEWRLTVSRILDWLMPLAQSSIKWYSERNFKKQCMTSGANVLLVQTLYFADQVKTEAAITKLLMGLNYLSSLYKEVDENPFLDSSCKTSCDVYVVHKKSISHSMINYA